MPSPFIAFHIALSLSSTAPVAAAPQGPEAAEAAVEAGPSPAAAEAPEPAPTEPEPVLTEESAPAELDPAPELQLRDPDAPKLEPRLTHLFEPEAATRVRDRRRSTAGGVLVGVGGMLGVAAPLFMLRPVKPFFLDTGRNGTSTKIGHEVGPIVAGVVVGTAGGVLTLLGARILSDVRVEPARVAVRQRALVVSSGVALGMAGGLFVAAAIDAARAGSQWSRVLARDASPEDAIDGEQVAAKASRALALFSAAPSLLGLGIGLGGGASATVVPTPSGLAMLGRF